MQAFFDLTVRELALWLAGLGAALTQIPAISEIDVNPVIVTATGGVAVDARVVTAQHPEEPKFTRET